MSGHSLLISWQLKDKGVLIVGGGEIAAQRIDSILHTEAQITLVAPSDGLNSRTKQFVASHPDRISYHDRLFSGVDELKNIDMVLTALDDPEVSREIVDMCRTFRIPVNAADIPPLCDFYFGAQIRDGPLQIMISTNGKGPRMASLIRDRLQKGLTGIEGGAIQKVGELRELLKERAPGIGGEVGKKRMKWMTKLCNTWSLEELAMLDKETMSKLLDQGWKQNAVPTLKDIGGRPRHDVDKTRTGDSFVFSKQVFFASVIGIMTGSLCTAYLMAVRRQ
ncbi:siroheme synthase [Amanita muscaria]